MKNYQLPLQQHAARNKLYWLATQLPLTPQALETALHTLGMLPDRTRWSHWLTLLFLGLGSGLFLSGVMFFFAYNWEDMHRFTRFALLASGIVFSAVGAWWRGIDNLLGQVLLTTAAVLTGILLATFGMVYQTGADSFMLFQSWLLLILPWVLISRFQPLWLIAVVIANTAIFTWADVASGIFEDKMAFIIIFISSMISITVLLLREFTPFIRQPVTTARWFPRLLMVWLLFILSYSPFNVIIDTDIGSNYQAGLVLLYFMVLAGVSYYVLFIRHDLFVLACVLLSIVVLLITVLIQALDFGRDTIGNFLIMGFAIGGMMALASKLLLMTAKKWQTEGEEAQGKPAL